MRDFAFSAWVNEAPVWQIGIILLVGMAISGLIGWAVRLHRDRNRSHEKADEENENSYEGYMISSVLGLLALLTGFTFSLAIDRYDTRRERVLAEANSIGTTYLRAQLLEEPHRARISGLLIDYLDNRVELGHASREKAAPLLARNDRYLVDMWTATVAAFPTMRGFDFSSAFLDSMNGVIELDAARKAARQARVPYQVYLILFIYQFISAGALGFVLPAGIRGKLGACVVFVLFGVALMLVLDIDRPNSGWIRETQGPMELLRDTLHDQPPALFDRFNAPGGATAPPS